jgi:hypothetical protein
MSYRVLNWDEGTVGWKCTERAGDWRITRGCPLPQNRNICKHYMPCFKLSTSRGLQPANHRSLAALSLNAKPSLPAGLQAVQLDA